MTDTNNVPILKRDLKHGTSFAVTGTIIVGIIGLIYGFIKSFDCKENLIAGPSCMGWHWIITFFYGIAGIFLGFVIGAIIGMIADAFSSKK